MIRIGAVIPKSKHAAGIRSRREVRGWTRAAGGIRQRDEELARCLVDISTVVWIDADLAQHGRALRRRRREKMRIAMLGRNVEAAHGARGRGGGREAFECIAGS